MDEHDEVERTTTGKDVGEVAEPSSPSSRRRWPASTSPPGPLRPRHPRRAADLRRRDRSVIGDRCGRPSGWCRERGRPGHPWHPRGPGLGPPSPETIAAMKAGANAITKDGWNLGRCGTATSSRTRCAGLRPAQGATSVAASAGPAMAIMAIQMQLAEISKLVEENIALTRSLLQAVGDERWAAAKAHFDAIAEEFGHADALGEVTPSIWGPGPGPGQRDQVARAASCRCWPRASSTTSSRRCPLSTARRAWLDTNAASVTQEAQTLLMAQQRVFAIRHCARSPPPTAARDPQDAALLERVLAGAQRRDAEVRAVAFPLLEGVYRLLRMLEEGTDPPGRNSSPGPATERRCASRPATSRASSARSPPTTARTGQIPSPPPVGLTLPPQAFDGGHFTTALGSRGERNAGGRGEVRWLARVGALPGVHRQPRPNRAARRIPGRRGSGPRAPLGRSAGCHEGSGYRPGRRVRPAGRARCSRQGRGAHLRAARLLAHPPRRRTRRAAERPYRGGPAALTPAGASEPGTQVSGRIPATGHMCRCARRRRPGPPGRWAGPRHHDRLRHPGHHSARRPALAGTPVAGSQG